MTVHISGTPSRNGEIGNYAYFRNCTFQNNEAILFGGALATSSVIVLGDRENIKPLDIQDW